MKRTFDSAVIELIRQGEDSLKALKKVEDSGEFSEEEIQEWFDKFNGYRARKTTRTS